MPFLFRKSDHRQICTIEKRNDYSHGYFHGDDPFDYAFPALLFELILALLISRGLHFLLKPLKQPMFVSSLLCGIMLGPSILGRNLTISEKLFPAKDKTLLNTLAVLGGIYFIFIVVVKMDAARIVRMAKNEWHIGIICFVVTFTFSYSIAYSLSSYIPGMADGAFTFVLSAITSLTYFPVVAQSVTELNLLTSELGRLSMSTAIFNELIGWFSLALSPLLRDQTTEVINTELSMLALVSFTFFILRPAVVWIVKTTPEGRAVKEIYIIAILLGVLIMATLSDLGGFSYLPGVVLMGLIIPAGPPLGSAITERCEVVITNFFMPIFFIRVGQLTDLYTIVNWTQFVAFQSVIFGSYIGKLAASLLCMVFIKTSFKNAFLFSCILNLKGVMDLVVVLRWRARKYVDPQCFTQVVLTYLVMTAILTPLISIFYKPRATMQVTPSMESRMRTLATTPMNTELRILCCIHFEESVHGIITLLKAFNPTEISPICAYVVNLVELVGRAAPLLIPYNVQKRKIRVNSTDRIMRAMSKFSKSSSAPVTIQPFTLIAPYKIMHESISNLARDKFIPFILVPFHQVQTQEIEGKTASLQNFNLNVQAYSPCTIGIFVDRGLPRYLSSNYFSYNVAVFFLGGPDDREAIALASRMSGHPDINITLYRIELIEPDLEQDECETFLDDSVLTEFKSRNFGNESLVCHETQASSTLEVMDAIRSSQNDYDLVIVGKRRRAKSKLEKEMKPWADFEELGVIGDVLASADFCGGMIPILVIQGIGRRGSGSNVSDIMSGTQDRSHCSFTSSLWDKDHLGSRRTEHLNSRKSDKSDRRDASTNFK